MFLLLFFLLNGFYSNSHFLLKAGRVGDRAGGLGFYFIRVFFRLILAGQLPSVLTDKLRSYCLRQQPGYISRINQTRG
jgi:hypothetical protein